MSYRLPGTTRGNFWADLLAGRDLVTKVDGTRWASSSLLHPDKSHRGTAYSFSAGTLGDVSGFDAGFFGISPREAGQMDPQQRLLLEMSWEALENANLRPSDVRGSACGVFVGISSVDYGMRMADDLAEIGSTMITGTTSSIAANRISYFLDLRGPSISMDTACSSSLVAFHQACRSIQCGDASMALAGGVSLHLHPLAFVAFSKASMLSRQGRCRAFDAAGDGYVRSEGGGLFVLKDHEQALQDGDSIWAVVAGSRVNTDGKKSGLTVPRRAAQSSLLADVYREAGIDPGDIDYIEAHGTGTPVGDPIEAGALGEAIGQHRSRNTPLLIGSVKSNLGHLEAASGVAGLVKAVHCLKHRTVPATIHLRALNPHIDFDDLNLRVVDNNLHLRPTGRLIVGVNSFGFGGANAHVILESPREPAAMRRQRQKVSEPVAALPLIVSAKTAPALRAAAEAMAGFLRSHESVPLYDVAYTAAARRDWHEHRAVVFGSSHLEQAQALDALVTRTEPGNGVVTTTALTAPVRTVFLYSGNGSQWEAMGRRLFKEDGVFQTAVLEVDQIFEKWADFSLRALFAGDAKPGCYARTEVAQPALFAMQVGITEMMRSRGALPDMVAGHSVGEVAAAWAAGILTLDQAVEVIYQRSYLQGRLHGKGQMTAVAMPAAEVDEQLRTCGLSDFVSVACINSPKSVTVAGSVAGLAALENLLSARGVVFKRLDLAYAFHSPLMDPIEADLRKGLAKLTLRSGNLPFFSTVTGDAMAGSALDADYWWRNIRQPVMLDNAVRALHSAGGRLFVEIGPHPVLSRYVDEVLRQTPEREGRTVSTVVRADDSQQRVWRAASMVMLTGAPSANAAFFPHFGQHVELPDYPWQKERHWHAFSAESQQLLQRQIVHPLLGYRLVQQEHCWETELDTQVHPMLADHVVGGAVLFPAAAFAELGLALAVDSNADRASLTWIELEDIEIRAPLVLSSDVPKALRVGLDGKDGSFVIKARDKFSQDPWALHANGRVRIEPGAEPVAPVAPTWPSRPPDFDAELHAATARSVGLAYGPAFSAVEVGWVDGVVACARLRIPQCIAADLDAYLLHPSVLDSAFQLVVHLLAGQVATHEAMAFVPTRVGRLRFCANAGLPAMVRATLARATPHGLRAHFEVFDAHGGLVAKALDVRFKSVQLRSAEVEQQSLMQLVAVAMPRHGPRDRAHPALNEAMSAWLPNAAMALQTNVALRDYTASVAPRLDDLCTAFASSALLGLMEGSDRLSDEQAHALVEQTPQAAELLVWLLDMLEGDETLLREEGGWRFNPTLMLRAPHAVWNQLLADHPEHAAIIHAAGRAGLHLASILRGVQAHLPARTMGSSPADWLLSIWGDDGWRAIAGGLARCTNQAVARLAEGQRLRVVVLAETSLQLAGMLMRAVDPDRVDVWVVHAEAQGPEVGSGQVPSVQGLGLRRVRRDGPEGARDAQQLATCDLAILIDDFSDPLEARQSLEQAHHMLAPDGNLCLVAAPSQRWQQLVGRGHGVDESDTRGLSEPVLLAHASDWQRCMEALGFTDCETLSTAPQADCQAVAPYLMRARKAAALVEPTRVPLSMAVSPHDLGQWFLLIDAAMPEHPLAAALLAQMHDEGRRCTLVRLPAEGPVRRAEFLTSLLSVDGVQSTGIAGLVVLPTAPHAHAGNRADEANALFLQARRRCVLAADLVQACEQLKLNLRAWFITDEAACHLLPGRSGPDATPWQGALEGDAPLWALIGVLRNEASHVTARLIDIERPETGCEHDQAQVRALAAELLAPDQDAEILLARSGARYATRLRLEPRHVAPTAAPADADNAHLGFKTAGQLRHLHWLREPKRAPAAGQITIDVVATGLNFRDVMFALGMLSDEAVESGFAGPTLGLECAGIVSAVGAGVGQFAVGDRVVAFGSACFGRQVTTAASAASHLPPSLSLEAAATIPSAFFTAYYAIVHLARARAGERILIHGAAGGVGIAAVQLARHLGLEIHATAGSDEKRDFLRLMGVQHIYDSRTLAFADQIMEVTGGQGVDMVLNSLAGEAVNRNLNVLKPFGRFLELGKRDFYENTRIGLRPFRNNITYFGIDADQLMVEQPQLTSALFADVMALFASGALHALPFVTFEADQVVDAFRHMQQARQIGKIVVTYREGIHPLPRPAAQAERLSLPSDASYLVTGGLSGFGLRTAQWLADRGARHLVLIGRQGPVSTEAVAALEAWRQAGVQVLAEACDVTDAGALQALLARVAELLPPLRGVVHAAAVFDDALLRQLSPEQLQRVYAPKALGARHLHELTRGMSLDFFVLYSSVATVIGNPGQAAYVAGNAALESLARARRAAGMPALCVRWGPIDDYGYLARNTQVRETLKARLGGQGLRADQALKILEELMLSDRSDRCAANMNWSGPGRFLPTTTDPKFSELTLAAEGGTPAEDEAVDMARMLSELDPQELEQTIRQLLKNEIGTILRVAPEKIDDHRSVLDLGLDSMMGVELAMAIEARFGAKLPVMALTDSPTVAKLASRIIGVLKGQPVGAGATAHEALQVQVQSIADQHAVEMHVDTVAQFSVEFQAADAQASTRLIR